MTVLSAYKATYSTSNVLSGDQSLSGAQPGSVLVKGELTVAGAFYVPGDLQVEGDLIFSSPTQVTIDGNLIVGGRVSGTVAGPVYIRGDVRLDGFELPIGSSVVTSATLNYFQTATTTGSPSYDGGMNETTVTISTTLLDFQQSVRVSPFSSDISILNIASSTQFVVSGNQTATFPDGTTVRLYDSPGNTTLIITESIPGVNYLRKPGSTTNYLIVSGAFPRYSLSGDVTAIFPASTTVNGYVNQYEGYFATGTLNFSNNAVTILKDLIIGQSATFIDISTCFIGGDLRGRNVTNQACTFSRSTAYSTGTTVQIIGDVKGLTTVSTAGYSSTTQSGCSGGSLTIRGSVYGPAAGVKLHCYGGAYIINNGAFNGGAGGALRVQGTITPVVELYTYGGATSGTGTPGAGGSIWVGGMLSGMDGTNSPSIHAYGGLASLGSATGGAGGSVTFNAGFLEASGGANIQTQGGNANTSSTTSIGGAGGNVVVYGRLSGSVTCSGGTGGLTGGASGGVTFSNCVLSNITVTATGGAASNSAVANRTGATGGSITISGSVGSIATLTSNGGATTGGTQTGCVGGNGGIVTVSGNLTITTISSNGGSSLTTGSSFAGQPGEITLAGNLVCSNLNLRTTPQSGVTGTTPTITGNNARLSLSGIIMAGTVDVTNNTGSRIQPSSSTTLVRFTVETLTTRLTLTDHSGNQSASQATLCKSRLYRYDVTNGTWQYVGMTMI